MISLLVTFQQTGEAAVREMIYGIRHGLGRRSLLKLLNIDELHLVASVACENNGSPLINLHDPLVREPRIICHLPNFWLLVKSAQAVEY